MRHGDEIQVLNDGLSVRPKAVEPIGISDGTQCWGVWIDKRQRYGVGEQSDDGHGVARDFVISPIHPELWPVAFRVEATLNHIGGTLYSLAKALLDHNVNILHAHLAPGGYTNEVFSAICSFDPNSDNNRPLRAALELRAKGLAAAAELDDPDQRTKVLNRQRQEACQALGLAMLPRLMGVWAGMRTAEKRLYRDGVEDGPADEKLPHFLARRPVEEGLEPWFLNVLAPNITTLGPYKGRRAGDNAAKASSQARSKAFDKMLQTPLDGPPRRRKGDQSDRPETLAERLIEFKKVHLETFKSVTDDGDPTVQSEMAESLPQETWNRKMFRRLAWRHTNLPLTVQALMSLAEMWCWSVPENPVEFRYDGERHLLVPVKRGDFIAGLQYHARCNLAKPHQSLWALGTFHPEDRHLRLQFLNRNPTVNRVRAHIRYRVERGSGTGEKYLSARTKGLVAKVGQAVYFCEGRILRFTNSVSTFNPTSGEEEGRLQLTVELPDGSDRSLMRDRIKSNLLQLLDPPDGDRTVTPPRVRVAVEPIVRDRIFVSTIQNHGRDADFCRILRKVALEKGLATVFSRQHGDGARDEVHRQMARCRYFLQIITPRAEDLQRLRKDPQHMPDFSWITYELGYAMALRRRNRSFRVIQMIDRLMPDHMRAQLRNIQGDVTPAAFRYDDDEQTLRQHFEDALTELCRDP